MTGQYSHTNGIRTLDGTLEPARQHLAHADAGGRATQTAMIGKWHLGAEPDFDHYAVLPGQGSYFNPDPAGEGNGQWPENERRFCRVRLRSLLRRDHRPLPRVAEDAGPGQAILPHAPLQGAARQLRERRALRLALRGRRHSGAGQPLGKGHPRSDAAVLATAPRSRSATHDATWATTCSSTRTSTTRHYTRTAYQRYLKKYLRCVRGVDDGIGRLLAHLEKTGELDNTVIIYTSDQGFMLGEHDYIDKRWMYEESLRMPFIVR